MTEEQVRKIIHEELGSYVASDRFTFHKHVQVFDGRNIQVGRTTGTKIGTATDQKLSVYGVTPITQGSAISSPTTPGATYDQSEALSMKSAVDSLRLALKNFGITG